jgi:zinc transport system substrate-binding protein
MKKFFTLLCLAVLGACGNEQQAGVSSPTSADVPSVYVVNYPLAWMVDTLAGGQVKVGFPVPPGEDPAFWEPDIPTVLEYQQADLVLLNGANYAAWVAKVSLPGASVVDTSRAYRERLIAVSAESAHSHGPEGEHSHGKLAFTTWLDLELAGMQLQAVAEALGSILPEQWVALQREQLIIQAQLAELDAQMLALGRKLDGAPVLYSHPVYQYLQQRYQLNGSALHWESDVMPDDRQWQLLEQRLQTHPAKLMFWEARPLPAVVEKLQGLGVQVVVYEPAGNRPSQGDFLLIMAANLAALEAALQAQGSG